MFSSLDIGYGIGLQTQYGRNILSISWMLIIIVVVILVLVSLHSTNDIGWGEFKDKFKDTWSCRIYIFISVVYRISLAIYLSSNIQYEYSPLIALSMPFTFMLYFIVNLPFKDHYHNYRSSVCHITHLLTILAINYYRNLLKYIPQ